MRCIGGLLLPPSFLDARNQGKKAPSHEDQEVFHHRDGDDLPDLVPTDKGIGDDDQGNVHAQEGIIRPFFLDDTELEFPLTVRNRRGGDRYRPLGSSGSQKVKEMMRARRIPEAERGRCPVFVSGNDIVWVRGLPVSEKYKVKDTTKTIFKIEIIPNKKQEY